MAVGTKELAPDQLDGFDRDRLVEELRKSKEELFNLRFQSATGQLDNHGRLKAVKRDIARIYTILRERELGIRPDVVAEVKEAKDGKAAKKSKKKAEPEAAVQDTTEPGTADAAEQDTAAGTTAAEDTSEKAEASEDDAK
ncbi:50S ribosomal protein L29 [Arthrobacter castelli]|uniref:50S ribosomal protein L29 n=1 Tax=Arthrobacter castelli TaxID=271431 RepID=UPI000401243E